LSLHIEASPEFEASNYFFGNGILFLPIIAGKNCGVAGAVNCEFFVVELTLKPSSLSRKDGLNKAYRLRLRRSWINTMLNNVASSLESLKPLQ
jgi:hypothetical protein